jgi:hypothetical protein
VIADKGFDADERVIDPLEKAGKTTVIPPKANRKHKRDYDKELVTGQVRLHCSPQTTVQNFLDNGI